MNDITRSTGIPIIANGVCYGMAGGGYQGATAELDTIVAQAAELLAAAYGQPVEIRFNSDRESGGAWLKTPDGGNAEIGIGASVITRYARQRWQLRAEQYEHETEAGCGPFGRGPGRQMTATQIEGTREMAADYRRLLAERPEGQLTVYAHITRNATLPGLRDELAALDGWNTYSGSQERGYHHGKATDVAAALARCLHFAPPTQPGI